MIMQFKWKTLFLLMFGLAWTACTHTKPAAPTFTPPASDYSFLNRIDSVTVRQHLIILSSDAMEGRGTGTAGEQRAITYISEQMKLAGLEPAAPNGTWFQEVPLLGATPRVVQNLTFTGGASSFSGNLTTDFTAATDLDATSIKTEGDLVFVGYGIHAPQLGWDDFKGMDLRGKILVSFVNDPPPTDQEPNRFKADTLTYYGRWTYKHEEARRQGAKGIVLIHTTPTASYPFAVLGNGATREQIQFANPPENPLELKAWITQQMGEQLATMSGSTLEQWFADAASKDFKPRAIPVKLALEMAYTVRRFSGTNVIGKITGSTTPNEAILFSSHHDHLGVGRPNKEGDAIYNGAVDNASGVAMLLTMAKALKSAAIPPKRTMVFASVTAEESGLLGSAYYALHPTFPAAQVVANLNVDSGNVYGKTNDISGIGAETSEMLRWLRNEAAVENMTVSPDPSPNAGLFFRSDQLSFARTGIPAFFLNNGRHYLNRPEGYYERMEGEYLATRYHQPDDEFDATWPMGGLVQQMRVCTRLGYDLAITSSWPQWKPGAEFEPARKASQSK